LFDVNLKGYLVNDKLSLCSGKNDFNGEAIIFAIKNPGGVIINSTLDGYLGLAPYTSES
jgi:hypothetical protein